MVQKSEQLVTLYDGEGDFTLAISKAIEGGYKFAPFVGAGFSVSAGIPTTVQMIRYLEYCTLTAFGLVAERHRTPWCPRREPWPQMTAWKSSQLPTSQYIKELWREQLSRHPGNYHLQQAFGALADWRSALHFLSQIESVIPSNDPEHPATLHLGPSDPSIIDSFFRELVDQRYPALTHKMLHALSTVLRADVLLTTNFDDLIERAFQNAGAPLTVYEVSSNDPLPTASLVLRERTLVKLHGGKIWLKADESLDELPTPEDIRNFIGYLSGRPMRPINEGFDGDLTVVNGPTALLICGVSGKDRRIQHLLMNAVAWMPALKIFWMGYTQADFVAAEKLARLVKEFCGKHTSLQKFSQTTALEGRINFCLHSHPGLFLLRLIQVLSKATPPSGAIFPALWHLPSPPAFYAPNSDKSQAAMAVIQNKLRCQIRKQLGAYSRGKLLPSIAPILIEVNANSSGGLWLASEMHKERNWGDPQGCAGDFNESVRSLWIDLDDIAEPAGFFLRISMMIANACGEPDPISRLNISDFYSCAERHAEFCSTIAEGIRSLTQESGTIWLITINAKEEPGSNSLFNHCLMAPSPRSRQSWLDHSGATLFSQAIGLLINKHRLPLQFVFVYSLAADSQPEYPLLNAVRMGAFAFYVSKKAELYSVLSRFGIRFNLVAHRMGFP